MKTHFHDNNPTKVWFDTGPIIFHIWSHVKLEKKGGGGKLNSIKILVLLIFNIILYELLFQKKK